LFFLQSLSYLVTIFVIVRMHDETVCRRSWHGTSVPITGAVKRCIISRRLETFFFEVRNFHQPVHFCPDKFSLQVLLTQRPDLVSNVVKSSGRNFTSSD